MEINLNSAIQNANPAVGNNAAGVAAPQTTSQRADVAATRVVSSRESANIENQAQSADVKRFDAVKSMATKYIEGKNKFLSDYSLTIYGSSQSVSGEYVVRFTDLGTGVVEVKSEPQIFAGTGGGDIVSGAI